MKAAVSTCALALSGCVATYAPPAAGPTASVYATDAPASFRIYDNENCDNLRSPPGLDMSVPIKVAAGKPLHVGRGKVGVGMVNYQCVAHSVFTPVEAATYEIDWKISMMPLACENVVTRVHPDGRRELEPSARAFVPGKGCAHKN